jgi:hypothetical protein
MDGKEAFDIRKTSPEMNLILINIKILITDRYREQQINKFQPVCPTQHKLHMTWKRAVGNSKESALIIIMKNL